MQVFESMGSCFDQMLGDISYEPESEAGKLYPFFVRVGCIKRRPPRHEFFEYMREMGMALIEPIMNHDYIDGGHLSFVFPERWLGVAEQQAFSLVMSKHPEVKKIKSVDILTSSPLIIGSFMADQVRIISWPDDDMYNGSNSENR